MNALDSLFASCIPSEESPNRRPSISSKHSNKQTLLTTMEETFDSIVETIHELPIAMEQKFDKILQGVTDFPATIEESFDEIIQTLNEYFGSEII